MVQLIPIDEVRRAVREVLREELTSGDATLRKLITELVLSAVLKDSAGTELSNYIKNLDVLLSTRASEVTLSAIRSQTDRLNFDSANRLRVSPADAEAMLPVDIQARYKPPGATLYSGTVTASGDSVDIDVSTITALELILKVTAVSGTNPVLSVYIEGKFEATGDYKPLVYQENITATGIWFSTITQLAFRYIRVRWVVSGTSPSFTFTVAGQAMV
jgi:hypothetical protein